MSIMESRLFIGYKVPRTIIETIAMTRSTLNDVQKNFNWVSGNNLHLTLLFLGDHKTDSITGISSSIEATISQFSDFTVSIDGTGTFGNNNQVLWLGVEKGKEQLQRINYELQISLLDVLGSKNKSKFIPHLTVARKKKTEINNNFDVKNFTNSVYSPVEFHINFFTLFESKIVNNKVHYKRITKFNLT
tara:strand:- start:953 stop:1519 length:567 start_codon:yes stop_codon:yes gene_type:complete